MKMTFRWYGSQMDPIPLRYIKQIPNMSGVVSSLMDMPAGALWPTERIQALKQEVNDAGLELEVIESVNVHEDIKLGLPGRDEYIDNYCKTIERLGQAGVKVIVNTAPYSPVTDEFLSGCYLVTPNEVEAEELTGICVSDLESADKAAKVFKDKGVQNVVITLGSRGVYVNEDGKSEIVPAYKVNAIDTTGAGDAFNGGLLTALSEGKTIGEAARFANALAAISVQRIGTTPSMPTRAEIDKFLEEHP